MTHVVLLLPSESDPVRGCEGWSFYRSVNLGVSDERGDANSIQKTCSPKSVQRLYGQQRSVMAFDGCSREKSSTGFRWMESQSTVPVAGSLRMDSNDGCVDESRK